MYSEYPVAKVNPQKIEEYKVNIYIIRVYAERCKDIVGKAQTESI